MISREDRLWSSSIELKPMLASAARLAYAIVPSRSRIVTASARMSRSSVTRGQSPRTRSPSEPPGSSSASAEDILRRVDQRQPLRYAGQAQQALDLRRSVDQIQLTPAVLRGLVGLDEDAQPSRVHELERAQVDDHEPCIGGERALQRFFEGRAGRQ